MVHFLDRVPDNGQGGGPDEIDCGSPSGVVSELVLHLGANVASAAVLRYL